KHHQCAKAIGHERERNVKTSRREPGKCVGGKDHARVGKKPNKYPNRQQKSCEHHAGCQYRNRRMSQPLIQQADHDESSQWQQGYEPYRRVSYHFNLLSMSISVVFNLLYRTVRMARPTATSAAATAIMKKTNTCPAVSPW